MMTMFYYTNGVTRPQWIHDDVVKRKLFSAFTGHLCGEFAGRKGLVMRTLMFLWCRVRIDQFCYRYIHIPLQIHLLVYITMELSWDRITEIPILVRLHRYIETATGVVFWIKPIPMIWHQKRLKTFSDEYTINWMKNIQKIGVNW